MSPKSTPERVALVTDESADPVERAAAVSVAASDRLRELEPAIARLLGHEAPELRAAAVLALVGRWRLDRYLDDAVRLVLGDPVWQVRADAATALGWYAGGETAERRRALDTLAKAVATDADASVQRRAYGELLRLAGGSPLPPPLPDDFDRERDVDWSALEELLAERPP